METKTIGVVIVALLLGAGIGYAFAGTQGGNEAPSEEYTKAVQMMNDQAKAMNEMSMMMRQDAQMMQELGVKYKDEGMMSMGKDTMMMAEKYMPKAKSGDRAMDEMMNE